MMSRWLMQAMIFHKKVIRACLWLRHARYNNRWTGTARRLSACIKFAKTYWLMASVLEPWTVSIRARNRHYSTRITDGKRHKTLQVTLGV